MLKHYISGEGPHRIVLLHGFMEDLSIWEDYVHQLDNEFEVVSLDLPGFGENPPIKQETSIKAMAEEVLDTLNDLPAKPYVCFGHSLGGYVAQELSKKANEDLKGIGLFHSTLYDDTEEKKQSRDKTIAFVEENGLERFLPTFFKGLFYEPNLEVQEKTLERLNYKAEPVTVSTFVHVMRAMRNRPDNSEYIQNRDLPVLFVVGRNDSAVDFESSKEQFFLPKESFIHVLNKCGHMGMVEHPNKGLAAIAGFAHTALERETLPYTGAQLTK